VAFTRKLVTKFEGRSQIGNREFCINPIARVEDRLWKLDPAIPDETQRGCGGELLIQGLLTIARRDESSLWESYMPGLQHVVM